MINFFHILALFYVKNADFFGKNIFKNHNIGPWLTYRTDWLPSWSCTRWPSPTARARDSTAGTPGTRPSTRTRSEKRGCQIVSPFLSYIHWPRQSSVAI
jgi:hypothetical protein